MRPDDPNRAFTVILAWALTAAIVTVLAVAVSAIARASW